MIDNSAAASDRTCLVMLPRGPAARPSTSTDDEHSGGSGVGRSDRPVRGLVEPAVLALVIGGMTAVMYASHRSGHWWGDDWALYIRQAEGLLDGEPGAVFEQNRFTVETSRGAPFSPPVYPWGFPLLLTPFVAVIGRDVDRLTIVPVLCAAVFACCWYALARPRLGAIPAMIGVIAVVLTPLLLGWTELIQSEWPFLAVTGVALVGLDRAARSDVLVDDRGRLLPLVLIGLGAAAAFSVRREGLAMTAAVAAAQVAALIAVAPWRTNRTGRRRLALRLLIPHATALAAVGLLQLALPTTLVPRYDGTSVANVWHFADRHVEHLAEVSGLKRAWEADPTVFDNVVLGWSAVVSYLAAALVGIALALGRHRRRDLHLVAYAIVAFLIGGSFRVAINRYVTTVAPILLLLGLVGLATLVQYAGRPRLSSVTVSLVVAAIAAGNLAEANVRIDRATAFADAGRIEWGPTHPDAVDMFAAVRSSTEPGDIVAAPKARAMTLETGRPAVQVDDFRPIPADVDVAIVVTERDTDLADELRDDPARFEAVWQNERFVIFRPR